MSPHTLGSFLDGIWAQGGGQARWVGRLHQLLVSGCQGAAPVGNAVPPHAKVHNVGFLTSMTDTPQAPASR